MPDIKKILNKRNQVIQGVKKISRREITENII
jgi:hypothetical protein